MNKVEKIIEDIINGNDPYYDYSYFDSSDIDDYDLRNSTIEEMMAIYDINEQEAVEIIDALTHGDEKGSFKDKDYDEI